MEDHPREVAPDAVHQVAEQLERLVLVGDQRLDLREPAQVDALAQVVHVVQVLAPAVVDDLQQDVALQGAHQLGAQLLLALLVRVHDVRTELLDDRGAVGLLGVELLRVERDRNPLALSLPTRKEVAGAGDRRLQPGAVEQDLERQRVDGRLDPAAAVDAELLAERERAARLVVPDVEGPVGGLVHSGWAEPEEIVVCEIHEERRGYLGKEYGVGTTADATLDALPDEGEDAFCKMVTVTVLDAGPADGDAEADPPCEYSFPCGLTDGTVVMGCELYAPGNGPLDARAFGCWLQEGHGCSDGPGYTRFSVCQSYRPGDGTGDLTHVHDTLRAAPAFYQ